MNKNKKRGFTIIELIVVIAIIAVMSGIVISSVSVYHSKSRIAATQAEVNQIAKALILYKAANGCFPDSGSCSINSTTGKMECGCLTALKGGSTKVAINVENLMNVTKNLGLAQKPKEVSLMGVMNKISNWILPSAQANAGCILGYWCWNSTTSDCQPGNMAACPTGYVCQITNCSSSSSSSSSSGGNTGTPCSGGQCCYNGSCSPASQSYQSTCPPGYTCQNSSSSSSGGGNPTCFSPNVCQNDSTHTCSAPVTGMFCISPTYCVATCNSSSSSSSGGSSSSSSGGTPTPCMMTTSRCYASSTGACSIPGTNFCYNGDICVLTTDPRCGGSSSSSSGGSSSSSSSGGAVIPQLLSDSGLLANSKLTNADAWNNSYYFDFNKTTDKCSFVYSYGPNGVSDVIGSDCSAYFKTSQAGGDDIWMRIQ